jgi:hydrogenase expression/formation protein HypE
MSAGKVEDREETVAGLGPFGECPLPIFDHPQIVLGHGSGGKLSAELIEKVFVSRFRNPTLDRMDDQAILEIAGARIAFTTDSFVVTPIFFPGGDIGSLAVNGTVNDLAVGGAKPLYLAAAFILEEGLPAAELARVADSVAVAAQNAGVQLVTGDTKVVNRGKGDKVFITTTGIGLIDRATQLSADRARPGDKILLSGYIGDHGITILSQRESLEFESSLESDCAALHGLVDAMLDEAEAAGALEAVRVMRDPTRGGVATVLNEIAVRSRHRHGAAGEPHSGPRYACAGPAKCLGLIRSTLPTKASSSRLSRRRLPTASSAPCGNTLSAPIAA